MHIQEICICIFFLFFHNKSNEITSLWPVFCIYDIKIHIFVVSSRRNKTNPHHRNKFIPVLNATHLQAFKPKLSTYDQLLKINQQDVSFYIFVCISWNIFNRIHFFATCDVFKICAICSCFMWYFYIWLCVKSWRSSFDKLFFFSYTIYFTLLTNCCNTVVLAEQSLHHNIILEKLDHCWVNRICTKLLISVSHTTRLLIYSEKCVNLFAYSFFFIQLFVFLTFIFILYMKLSQSICWFIFFYSAIWFPHIHFHI
jgi:hypothetical protein